MAIAEGGASAPQSPSPTSREEFHARLRTFRSKAQSQAHKTILDYVSGTVKHLSDKNPSDQTLVCALLQFDKGNLSAYTLDMIIIAAIDSDEELVREIGPDRATPLHSAMLYQRKLVVDHLIAKGANIEARDSKSRLALHYAAMGHGTELIRALNLDDKSPLARAQDCDGKTPLAAACKNNSYLAARYLLEKFPSTAWIADNNQFTSFHVAASRGQFPLVEALCKMLTAKQRASINHGSSQAPSRRRSGLDAQFSIDQQTRGGYTALHLASKKGHLDIVTFLLSQGADPTVVSETGEICVWYAVRSGHLSIVERLLKEASVRKRLNECNHRGSTLLSFCFQSGNRWAIAPLVNAGASCSAENGDGSTPLTDAIRLRNVDALEIFLNSAKLRFNIDKAIKYGGPSGNLSTALHAACQYSNLEAVIALLGRVTNPDIIDGKGRTSLHQAVSQGDSDIVKILLQAGCDVNATDNDGWSPLHFACDEPMENRAVQPAKNDGVTLLESEMGKPVSFFPCKKDYDGIIELLGKYRPNMSAQTSEGDTALHIAARHGHERQVDELPRIDSQLFRLVPVEKITNMHGKTALECALDKDHYRIAEKLALRMDSIRFKDEKCRDDLLKKLSEKNQYGLIASLLYKEAIFQQVPRLETVSPHDTPLELATFRGLTGVVRSLLHSIPSSPARDCSIQAACRVCKAEIAYRESTLDSGAESDGSSRYETQSQDHFKAILNLLQWPPMLTDFVPRHLRPHHGIPEQLPDVARHYKIMVLHLRDQQFCQYALPFDEFIKDETNQKKMKNWQWREDKTNPATEPNVEWIHLPANSMQWMEVRSIKQCPILVNFTNLVRKNVVTILSKTRTMNLDALSWLFSTWTELRGRSNETGYMKPRCVASPTEPALIAAYMPYLTPAWYSKSHNNQNGVHYADLLRHYESKSMPIHGTRTLDEYFLHFCASSDMEKSIAERNQDQVLSRALYPELSLRDSWILINVDHLWVWVLDNTKRIEHEKLTAQRIETVITSVTHRRDSEHDQVEAAALDSLRYIINTHGLVPQDAQQMAAFIMDVCVDFFGRAFDMQPSASTKAQDRDSRPGTAKTSDIASSFDPDPSELLPAHCEPTHAEAQAPRVCIRESFTDSLAKHAMQESEIYKAFVTHEESPRKNKAVAAESGANAAKLCRQIKDIRDELEIITAVANSQKSVFAGLEKITGACSEHLSDIFDELEAMKTAAKRIESALNATLSLQQNAVTIEQARAAVQQGKVMMVFTTFTVLFMPSSAFSSLFSMQVETFQKTPGWAFAIMFGVSACLLVITVTYAFVVFWKPPPQQDAAPWRDRLRRAEAGQQGGVAFWYGPIDRCRTEYRVWGWRGVVSLWFRKLSSGFRSRKQAAVQQEDIDLADV